MVRLVVWRQFSSSSWKPAPDCNCDAALWGTIVAPTEVSNSSADRVNVARRFEKGALLEGATTDTTTLYVKHQPKVEGTSEMGAYTTRLKPLRAGASAVVAHWEKPWRQLAAARQRSVEWWQSLRDFWPSLSTLFLGFLTEIDYSRYFGQIFRAQLTERYAALLETVERPNSS